MAKKMNTTSSIATGAAEISEREYRDSMARALEVFKAMKKVSVSIPKQMRSTMGDSVPVTINGCSIVIPVDGQRYDVPEAFADVLNESMQVIQAEDVKAEIVEERGLKGSS